MSLWIPCYFEINLKVKGFSNQIDVSIIRLSQVRIILAHKEIIRNYNGITKNLA